MTAIEYLIEVFFKSNVEKALFQDEINKAKEMEKQQIIDAFESGYGAGEHASEQLGSEYYNETFKNK